MKMEVRVRNNSQMEYHLSTWKEILFSNDFLSTLVIYYMRLVVISIELLSFKKFEEVDMSWIQSSLVLLWFYEMKNEKFAIKCFIEFIFFFISQNIKKWKIGLVTFVPYMLHIRFTNKNKSSWHKGRLLIAGSVLIWYIFNG